MVRGMKIYKFRVSRHTEVDVVKMINNSKDLYEASLRDSSIVENYLLGALYRTVMWKDLNLYCCCSRLVIVDSLRTVLLS